MDANKSQFQMALDCIFPSRSDIQKVLLHFVYNDGVGENNSDNWIPCEVWSVLNEILNTSASNVPVPIEELLILFTALKARRDALSKSLKKSEDKSNIDVAKLMSDFREMDPLMMKLVELLISKCEVDFHENSPLFKTGEITLSNALCLADQETLMRDKSNIYDMLFEAIYVKRVFHMNFVYSSLFCSSINLLELFCQEEKHFVEANDIFKQVFIDHQTLFSNYLNLHLMFCQAVGGQHMLSKIFNWSANDSSIIDNWSSRLKCHKLFINCNVLVFLKYCCEAEQKIDLLPVLELMLEEWSCLMDPILLRELEKKKINWKTIQFCLHHFKSLNISKFLRLLQDHSQLYAMQASIPLYKLPYDKVLDLFSHNEGISIVYKGFYIVLISFTAIISGIEIDKSVNTWRHQRSICYSVEESQFIEDETDINACKSYYQRLIAKQLEYIRYIFEEVCALRLDLALDILENLFSLLFVTNTSLSDEGYHTFALDEGEASSPNSLKQEIDEFPSNSSIMSATSAFHFDNQFQVMKSTCKGLDLSCEHSSTHEETSSLQFKKSVDKAKIKKKKDRKVSMSSNQVIHDSSESPPLKFGTNKATSDFSSSSSVQDFSSCGYLMNSLVLWDHLLLLKDLIKVILLNKNFEQEKCRNNYSVKLCMLQDRVENALWKINVLAPHFQDRHLGSTREMASYMRGTLFSDTSPLVQYSIPRAFKTKKVKSNRSRKLSLNSAPLKRVNAANFILSSPENLLSLALVSGNLESAQQIIDKYQLQATKESQELILMNCLKTNVPQIEKLDSLNKEDRVISDVASNNIEMPNEFSISYLIDQTLGISLLDSSFSESDIYLNTKRPFVEMCPKLILLDIALTSKLSQASAVKLFHSAEKQQGISIVQEKFSKEEVLPFLHMYIDESRSLKRLFETIQALDEPAWSLTSEHLNPINWFLNKWPLGNNEQEVANILRIVSVISFFISNFVEQKALKYEDSPDYPHLISIYNSLLKNITDNESGDFTKLNKNENNNYMSTFVKYLKTLESLIRQNSATLAVCDEEKDVFSLLNERPVHILGNLIFKSGIDPCSLANWSQNMQFDILSVISKYLFPIIEIKPASLLQYKKDLSDFGCKYINNKYILNANSLVCEQSTHGDFVVRDLLASILDRIKDIDYERNFLKGDTALSRNTAPLFLKDQQIKTLLVETSSICSSDLNKLKSDLELFVFFVNLSNLMLLHCTLLNSLLFKSKNGKGGIFSPSKLEQYLSLKNVGYIVGSIGFISLFDLIYRVLKQPLLYEILGEDVALIPFLKNANKEPDQEMMMFCSRMEIPLNEFFPYLAFIVSQPINPTVKIHVFYPYTFEDALTEAISEYFVAHITLPSSLSYQESSVNPVLACFLVNYPSGIDQAIDSLKQYSPEEFTFYLDSLRKINIQRNCSTADNDKSICITIDYNHKDDSLDFKELNSHCHHDWLLHTRSSSATLLWKDFKPSSQVIDYVSTNCPIIAILMSNQFQDLKPKSSHKTLFDSDKLKDCSFLFNLIALNQEKCGNLECLDISVDWLTSLLSQTEYNSILEEMEVVLTLVSSSSYLNHDPDSSFVKMFQYFSLMPKFAKIHHSQTNLVWQQLLIHLASSNPGPLEESLSIVYKISELEDKILAVKQNYRQWTLDFTLKYLYYLKAEHELTVDHKRWILSKIEQLEIYDEILRLPERICSFTCLQDVHELSHNAPELMLNHLKDHRSYGLLVKWVSSHDLEQRFSFEMTLSYLLLYLDVPEPNFRQAKIILEDTADHHLSQIIQELLKLINVHQTRSFLIELYLIQVPAEDAKNSFRQELFALRQELMGLTLVECIAPKFFDRTQLFPLISKPHLILEQWIMNVKFEAIDKALDLLTPHLNAILDHSVCDAMTWHHFHSTIEMYASKALEISGIQVVTRQRLCISSLPSQFVIPLEVPLKSEWQPSSSVGSCPLCTNSVFSLFCRRHHCRRCGRVVCASCSNFRFKVVGYKVPVRICSYCYQHVTPKHRTRLRLESSNEASENSSTYSEVGWYFTTDPNQIKSIREEFSFDCAPSLSLCQAILSLHRDDKRAALCILKISHRLLLIAIDSISAEYSEVDANFVLRIIKTLVSSAKIRFSKYTDEEGICLCEYYNQWVDLLGLLLKDKCQRLLPTDALSNMIKTAELRELKLSGIQVEPEKIFSNLERELRYVKVLRDNLVKGEKWKLALNVSTKAGFETNGVWGAWAMASLKAGDFATARDHFSKVLTKPRDKCLQSRPSIICDIISFLENHPQLFRIQLSEKNSEYIIPGSTSDALIITQTLRNLNSIADGKINLVKDFDSALPPKKRSLDPILQRECEYYIRLYGCHRMLLEFLLRQNRVLEAVKYCHQMDVPGDIFSEVVVLPFFQRGQFATLWKKIKQADSSQNWSSKIVLATCKWLEKKKYLHCLLEIQKQLKDFLRAAMTLTRLYINSADCFSELTHRKHYLNEISLQLQAYINQMPLNETPQNRMFKKGLASLCLQSPSWVVNQQIHLCTFQEDAVKFLAEIEMNTGSLQSLIIKVQSCVSDMKPHSVSKIHREFQVPSAFSREERLVMSVVVVCSGGNLNLGLSLVQHLVEVNALQPKELLMTSLEVLRSRRNLIDIPTVIETVLEWGLIADSHIKALLNPTLLWAAKNAPNYVNRNLIDFLTNNEDKTNAFIEAGLFKQAYFILMKEGSKSEMENLMRQAELQQESVVVSKCKKWLQNYHENRLQPSILRNYDQASDFSDTMDYF